MYDYESVFFFWGGGGDVWMDGCRFCICILINDISTHKTIRNYFSKYYNINLINRFKEKK